MSEKVLRNNLFIAIANVVLLLLGGQNIYAQTPGPAAPSLSDSIARLSLKAAQLLPYLQYEVLSRIQDWVYGLAVTLAVLVLLFGFLRLWRENSGGGSNLIFFFVRSLFFFGLVGSSVWIIGQMAATGIQIAEGDEIRGGAGRSMLFEFYKAQRDSFNESYEKLTMGTFTVKVDGRDFTVKPSTPNAGTFVGVLYDSEGTVKDLDRKLNDSSFTLPALFNWLNAARTILEGGDFWLLVLGSVLLLVFKASAPLMMAVAIDQKLAHKITYPFVWGAGVLTLVWPAVSYFIRAVAYLFGNMAMALGDSDPLYSWDYATMYAIKSNFASPVYTVAIAALVMTIAGGCLWVSPYLAYRFSMGQIYEGVSAAMSQFAAMIIGTGVEAYSATAAAGINQTAQNTQAQGSYDASTTEARANKESGMFRNQAGFLSGKAAALSAAQATAGAAMAAARAGASQAYTTFGSAAKGVAGVNENMAYAALRQQTGMNANSNTLAVQNLRSAYEEGRIGREAGAANIRSDADLGYISGVPLVGQIGGSSVAALQGRGQRLATNEQLGKQTLGVTEGRIGNQEGFTASSNQTAERYARETGNINREAGDRISAISIQQGRESADAAYAAAGTAISGHRSAMGLNNQATRVEFEGRVSAASITHTAANESARLQAVSAVVSRVGSRIAQDIEHGMEMHY
jgi:hypothetical protein